MRFGGQKRKGLLWVQITFLLLAMVLFSLHSQLSAKELAPHKIYGHLILEEKTLSNLDDYDIAVRLTRNNTDYMVARYEGTPLYDDYFVVDIPLDDSQKNGIAAPGDRVDLLVNGFVMSRDSEDSEDSEGIELISGQITKRDINLCKYTELELTIEGVVNGADYKEDALPLIKTEGCGVRVSATLNGAPYLPGTLIHEPDHYTLMVQAEDASGESKQAQVSFTRSKASPDEGLNGEFASGLTGWTIEGTASLISLTSDPIRGPSGYAALINAPGPQESAKMSSGFVYVAAGSIMDLSFYLYGQAPDELLLEVISYQDRMGQNPVPLVVSKKIPLTSNNRWQKVSTQLIIPDGQYFLSLSLGRSEETVSSAAMAIDNISLVSLSAIASTVSDGAGNLAVMVEEGSRNLLCGADEDLGLFDDPVYSTVCNLPGSTYGLKALKLRETQVSREVYLPSGTYTISFTVWSNQPQGFTLGIGSLEFSHFALPKVDRQQVTFTLADKGWYTIWLSNQGQSDLYLTRIQLEEGNFSTRYTSSGRSNGMLPFLFHPDEVMDFGKEGTFSFSFSPQKQGEDLFLAGCANLWSIEYRASDKSIIFSMLNMPDLCRISLEGGGPGPELLSGNIYEVLLSWNENSISLDLSLKTPYTHLGSSQSSSFNKEITCEGFSLGSRLIGINQAQSSNCLFYSVHYKTTCASGCSCLYSLHHTTSIPALSSLAHMSEWTRAELDLNHAPSASRLYTPANSSEITTLLPDLAINNSLDEDDDTLTYEFAIYPNTDLTPPPVASASGLPEGNVITSWACGVNLEKNTWYSWQARVFDGVLYSHWMEGALFYVNLRNIAPSTPTISYPHDQAEVTTLQPTLEIQNSLDPDGDSLTYDFEIYSDDALTILVVEEAVAEEKPSTVWMVSGELTDNTWYYWRIRANDGWDVSSWVYGSFFVNTFNDAPKLPVIISPADGSEVAFKDIALVAGNSEDPDSGTLTYFFEIDRINTFDSAHKKVSGGVEEGSDVDTTGWTVFGLDDNTMYYWRVKVSDGQAESTWSQGNFFVNTVNDPPTIPTFKNPAGGDWVETLTPRLELNPSQDPDHDTICYVFEIYDQSSSGSSIMQGFSETSDWTIPSSLNDNTWYWWRAQSKDEHGAVSDWIDKAAFFVNNNGYNDPPKITLTEPKENTTLTGGSTIIRWEDSDPDSNAQIILYYDMDNVGQDGTLIVNGLAEDTDGENDSFVWDITGVPNGTYYIYAVITDNLSFVTTYSTGSITITIDPNIPAADFSWSPESQIEGYPVQFTDTSISHFDTIVSWMWDFGDGFGSSAQNPSHIYSYHGSYSVSLTVTDSDGSEGSVSKMITITTLLKIREPIADPIGITPFQVVPYGPYSQRQDYYPDSNVDPPYYFDNNSSGDTEPEFPKICIPLQAGWNLISFSTAICWYDTEAAPVVPLPAGTELRRVAGLKEVFGSINGKYLMIHSFDNAGGHTFDPELDTQGFNDLHYLAPGYGYWIKMAHPATLELSGLQLEPSAALSLHSGWNLIGYWGIEAKYDTTLAPKVSLPDSLGAYLKSQRGTYGYQWKVFHTQFL